jgi:hypothetical protein
MLKGNYIMFHIRPQRKVFFARVLFASLVLVSCNVFSDPVPVHTPSESLFTPAHFDFVKNIEVSLAVGPSV